MRKPVLLYTVLLSILLAVANNLLNSRGIDWLGSPDILQKPSDWPSLGMGQGIVAGIMVAWKDAISHWQWVLGSLAVVFGGAWLQVRFRGASGTKWLLSWLRIGIGIMFLAAAWPKFSDPKDFAMLVAQYQFLPAFSVNLFSLLLSSFEIVVGLGLIFTPYEKEFGAFVFLMLGMFIIALGQALTRDLGIACGCFDIQGAADAGETWYSFIRDVVLIVPVVWLMAVGQRRWLWQV